MTSREYARQTIQQLSKAMLDQGFRVFLAESETYGFMTDADGTRVVCFQTDLGIVSLSGNYKTNKPLETGMGWRIGEIDGKFNTVNFACLFLSSPPSWALKGASWRFTTLNEHLATYQESSKYRELDNME